MEVKVNDKQLVLLQEFKEKQFALKREIHSDIFPALIESFKQVRELTQSIAIISGAIAAFTIPVVNTPFIQIKIFAYLAIVTLFVTISYAIYHLSEVIPKEINELSKQHSTYSALIDEEIDRINVVIQTGDINNLIDMDEEKVKSRLDTLKIEPKPDKSLDRLRFLLFLALLLLALSFIPPTIFSVPLQLITKRL